jgi:hypothetical protein
MVGFFAYMGWIVVALVNLVSWQLGITWAATSAIVAVAAGIAWARSKKPARAY